MTHEEKINYMRIATGIVGYGFDLKGIDMLVSIYDSIIENQGETNLKGLAKIEVEVEKRETERIIEKKKKSPAN
jgi:hypothetical protein